MLIGDTTTYTRPKNARLLLLFAFDVFRIINAGQ